MRAEQTYSESSMMAPASSPPLVSAAEAEIARRLARIWQDLLALDHVTSDQNFFDLGGDSSLAVRLFSQIEKDFGVKLPLITLYEAPTIEDLARILCREVASAKWSSLVAIQPSGTRPPLFCMHGGESGTVLIYRDLSRRLGWDQPLYGLQAHGPDGEDSPLASVEDMARVYVKEIRTVQPRGPYFLAGYGGGGTIAYETAQQLHAAGEQVALLALFDTMNWSRIQITASSKATYEVQRALFQAASFLKLDFASQSQFLREVVRSWIPVPRETSPVTLGKETGQAASTPLVFGGRIWQMNTACWHYLPQPYAGSIVDFRPSTQYQIFDKPELKWDKLAQGGQEIVVLPVNPASMLAEPFVEHLAKALRRAMDAAVERCANGSAGSTTVAVH